MPVDVDQLYRRYGPMVLRRCRRLLGSEEAARDAMQDVFVQVLRHQARLDAAAPSSLLFRVATNVCLNRIRAAGRRPELPDGELLQRIAGLEDVEARSLARSTLARLLGREPASTRTLVALHLVDGMTLEQVAREVGLSVSGVRKRLRGLRGKLQQLEEVT